MPGRGQKTGKNDEISMYNISRDYFSIGEIYSVF